MFWCLRGNLEEQEEKGEEEEEKAWWLLLGCNPIEGDVLSVHYRFDG